MADVAVGSRRSIRKCFTSFVAIVTVCVIVVGDPILAGRCELAGSRFSSIRDIGLYLE